MNGISPYKAKLLAEQRIRWEFGLNDLTVAGLAATAGYVLAAGLALLAARRAPGGTFDRRFWWLACAALAMLGINKQLDLHILLIDLGRALAVDHGLYQQRRAIQRGFMVAAAIIAVTAAIGGYLAVRHRHRAIRLALGGLALVAAYALIRAAVFNHTASPLRSWGWTIELAGIALTAYAAWRYAQAPTLSRTTATPASR